MEGKAGIMNRQNFTFHTEIVNLTNAATRQRDIKAAAQVIKQGGLVAFPTETVYGIGALAASDEAVKLLYAAKNRPMDKAFTIQVANVQMLQQVAGYVPQMARKLMEKYCPGPITIVLPKSPLISPVVTAGKDTVGIRIPDNPVALALLQEVGAPLVVPSANMSGHVSPKTAQDVYGDMAGRLQLILDGGACRLGQESTIVDCTGARAEIIRAGAIPTAEIMEAVK